MSYARADDDNDRVSDLKSAFETLLNQAARIPVEIFMGKTYIYWGKEWEAAIDEGISVSNFFKAVLTPTYFERHRCRQEFTKALKHKLKIYPLYY